MKALFAEVRARWNLRVSKSRHIGDAQVVEQFRAMIAGTSDLNP